MWALAYGQHEDRTPTHGHEATREALSPRVGTAGLNWWGVGTPNNAPAEIVDKLNRRSTRLSWTQR